MLITKSSCKIIFLVVIIFIVPVLLFSKAQASGNDVFKRGSKAIQFQLFKPGSSSSSYPLSEYLGATFSGIYYTSAKSAIRAGISIFDEERTASSESGRNLDSADARRYLYDLDYSRVMLKLDIQYIHYYGIKNKVVFFIGCGPSLSMDIDGQSYDRTRNDPSDTSQYYERRYTDRDMWTVGLATVFGVQLPINDWLSFHAEYGSNFEYYVDNQDSRYEYYYDRPLDITDYRNSAFRITTQPVKLGVSIYF